MSQGLSKKLVSVIITNVIAGALWTLACWCSRTTKWETQLFMRRPLFSKSHGELSHSVTFPGKMWVNASPTPREYTKETLLPRSSLVSQWILGGKHRTQRKRHHPGRDYSEKLHPGDPCRPCSQHHQRGCPAPSTGYCSSQLGEGAGNLGTL